MAHENLQIPSEPIGRNLVSHILSILFVAIFWGFTLVQFTYIKIYQLCTHSQRSRNEPGILFFHPFASDGGGGEKVLWHMLHALQSCRSQDSKKSVTLVHKFPVPDNLRLFDIVKNQFGIDFTENASNNFNIIGIYADKLRPNSYAAFTILRQGLASIMAVRSSFQSNYPGIFIDTVGVPFAYPLCHLLGIRVISYVHYPLISNKTFRKNAPGHYSIKSRVYHYIRCEYLFSMSKIYASCTSYVSKYAVNSLWTSRHIQKAWRSPKSNAFLLYPPVSDVSLKIKEEDHIHRKIMIVSVSQFRPEKNHIQQLRIFKKVLAHHNASFVLAGSVRDAEDRSYLNSLRNIAKDLGISKNILWKINMSNDERRELLRSSLIAIHTMVDEHFGIGIVEYLAAGCIVIAHDSGGPKEDIIRPAIIMRADKPKNPGECLGFLAQTDAEYSQAVSHILNMTENERVHMRKKARHRISDFSAENFMQKFLEFTSSMRNDF